MKPQWQVEQALRLADAGFNNCQIGRRIGVNRRTVSDWVRGRTRLRRPVTLRRRPTTPGLGNCIRCSESAHYVPGLSIYAYAYLLGMYLGDGMISSHPRGVYRLRIFLDRAYPVIVAECEAAMSIVMPASKAFIYRHPRDRVEEVNSFSQHWPHLFPQHGAGPKHKRRIALEPWQQRVVDRYPGRLLRGLIHSDGCRVTNKIRHPKKTYDIPATSSATARAAFRGSSAAAATGLGSPGGKMVHGISRWRVARRSRSWTVNRAEALRPG